MKKITLFLTFAAISLSTTAQISLSEDIKVEVPKELKVVTSSTVNKIEIEKAKKPLFSVDDKVGVVYFEKQGIVIKMFYQSADYLQKDFLRDKEVEFMQFKARSMKSFSHLNSQTIKMNGFSAFITEQESLDDPIGYLVCYGLPNSLKKYLFAAVQYNKENRGKALLALTSLLKGVKFK